MSAILFFFIEEFNNISVFMLDFILPNYGSATIHIYQPQLLRQDMTQGQFFLNKV